MFDRNLHRVRNDRNKRSLRKNSGIVGRGRSGIPCLPMPTFIDESGDTGTPGDGSAAYFRVAAVWMPTNDDVDLFRQKINRLRQELGESQTFEFKFSKTSSKPEWREAFFTIAMSQDFRFAFSSVDKRGNPASARELHWTCITELAAILRPIYYQAEECRESPLKELIVVDNNDDKQFLAMIKQQFRAIKSKRRPGSSMIGKVGFRGSEVHEMIQLADMVCGAAGAYIDGDDATWYHKIASRDLSENRGP